MQTTAMAMTSSSAWAAALSFCDVLCLCAHLECFPGTIYSRHGPCKHLLQALCDFSQTCFAQRVMSHFSIMPKRCLPTPRSLVPRLRLLPARTGHHRLQPDRRRFDARQRRHRRRHGPEEHHRLRSLHHLHWCVRPCLPLPVVDHTHDPHPPVGSAPVLIKLILQWQHCQCASSEQSQAAPALRCIESCAQLLPFGCCMDVSHQQGHALPARGHENRWLTQKARPCAGIFVNLSVRKPLVIDYKLPYPTGTATGVMINSFFTNGELELLPSTKSPGRQLPWASKSFTRPHAEWYSRRKPRLCPGRDILPAGRCFNVGGHCTLRAWQVTWPSNRRCACSRSASAPSCGTSGPGSSTATARPTSRPCPIGQTPGTRCPTSASGASQLP